MGKLKSILIKLEDNDELELDMHGVPVVPDEVYMEELVERAERERDARREDGEPQEQECND